MKNNSVVEVVIDNKERSYTTDQYLPLPEGCGICLRNEKYAIEEPAWLKHHFFENLFNLSLLAISIIFEVLLLIVSLAKKRIRNITEKNLIALFFVLLVCDIVGLTLPFTTNSLDKMSCKIEAVLLHFFSLALCIWPCIISYQIRYIFRSRKTVQRLNNSYLQYSIVAWGFSILVISLCLADDMLSKESFITYGKGNYCWISSFHARLVVYIVPFVIMNCGSSFLVFVSMLQTKRERREIRKKIAKNGQISYSKMLIKLFLLLGTGELIGLAQIPNALQRGELELLVNVIIGLLYNLLRSSRGIFMFALFGWSGICNKCREHASIST